MKVYFAIFTTVCAAFFTAANGCIVVGSMMVVINNFVCANFGIAAGSYHTIIGTQYDASATGINYYGQLGDGTNTDQCEFSEVFSSGVVAVAAGESHSAVVTTDGSVWTSGRNLYGELGDGTWSNTKSFVQVFSGSASDVVAGSSHTMVLDGGGNVWAVGYNIYGQLGDLSTTSTRYFVKVLTRTAALSAGKFHSIALKKDGTVWATGRNKHGQLGDGTVTDKSRWTYIMSDAKAVAAGAYHSLVLKEGGTVWSSGYNNEGQLGYRWSSSLNVYQRAFYNFYNAAMDVAAGAYHSLVMTSGGSVWTAGYNNYGQLGDGATSSRRYFKMVISYGVEAMAAGLYHSVVIKRSGDVYATGWNKYGQLGSGSKTSTTVFVKVASTQVSEYGYNRNLMSPRGPTTTKPSVPGGFILYILFYLRFFACLFPFSHTQSLSATNAI